MLIHEYRTHPAPGWVPFDPTRHGAESDFQVRAGDRLATVRRNGHGQIILSASRHLLPWVPVEMSV